MNASLHELLTLLRARGLHVDLIGDGSLCPQRVHSDTRTLQAGDLFVALRGERFDAHDFLPQAAAAGAMAALAQRASPGLPTLVVDDSRAALAALAGAWRTRFALPLIAVTGSNGKTTVTQMLASILRAWVGEAAALATAGNFNNDIGLPLTLLRLREGHRAAVVEIGMNHPGEIAPLAALAAPNVALVNNAQREHQEFMSSIEATAEENGAVFAALRTGGCAVYPADDACAPIWARLSADRRRCRFAETGDAEVRLLHADWRGTAWALRIATPEGELALQLPLPGAHNRRNALAAVACALAAGAPPQAVIEGIERFQAAKGRSALSTLTLGGAPRTLVDDSYNANPDSMRAALALLASLPAPRWALLGDMGEVGTQGPAFHAEIGAYARELGIEHLWLAGEASLHTLAAYGAGARHFDSAAALSIALPEGPLAEARSLLVKGSRFMRMEQAVVALKELAA